MRTSVLTVSNLEPGPQHIVHRFSAAWSADPGKCDTAAPLTFQNQILGDFSLWGVDQLGDSAVTIKGQVKTTPAGRWSVQREINRRIKQRFQALGIEIPFPVQTVLLGGRTPLDTSPHADDAQVSPPPRADPASPPPQALDHTA